MAFLTTFPFELREEIYTAYLTSISTTCIPPVTDHEKRIHHAGFNLWGSGDKRWIKQDDEFLEYCNYFLNPSIHPATPSNPALPLLLCNRQVNTEVSSVMSLLTSSSNKDWMRYELDCEIVDENKIYPTWLHIPFIRPRHSIPISCVYVTFRFSGQRVHGKRSSWRHGNGGPGPMIRSLQALLTRFLKWGPNFLVMPAETQRSISINSSSSGPSNVESRILDISIQKLVLDFSTPPILPEELHRREEKGETISARKAQKITIPYFSVLLHGGHRNDSALARDFIASRLRVIQWKIDGEDTHVFDLSTDYFKNVLSSSGYH